MPAKKIFVLDGHPAETSLSRVFADHYVGAARRAGHDVRVAHLSGLEFDDDFGQRKYNEFKPLKPAIQSVMNDIEWCDHMVLTTPMCWDGLPAQLKGLIDRAFVPGRAFDPRNPKVGGISAPILTGGRHG